MLVDCWYIAERAQAEEERAKASEEKFQKLKTMYTQIRDEHVNLLRQVRNRFLPNDLILI